MNYSVVASNWWANSLNDVSRKTRRRFAKELKHKVEAMTDKYGYCKLSTEAGTLSVLHDVLIKCDIPASVTPYNVRMDIHPKKIQVRYNGGRKETVFKIQN